MVIDFASCMWWGSFSPRPCPLKLFCSYLIATEVLGRGSPSFAESVLGRSNEKRKRNRNLRRNTETGREEVQDCTVTYICNPLSEALVHYKRKGTILKMIP